MANLFLGSLAEENMRFRSMGSEEYNMGSMFQTDYHRVKSVSDRHEELMLADKGSAEQ